MGTDGRLRRLNRRENIATIISKIRRRAVMRLVTSTLKNGGFHKFPYLLEFVYLKFCAIPFSCRSDCRGREASDCSDIRSGRNL